MMKVLPLRTGSFELQVVFVGELVEASALMAPAVVEGASDACHCHRSLDSVGLRLGHGASPGTLGEEHNNVLGSHPPIQGTHLLPRAEGHILKNDDAALTHVGGTRIAHEDGEHSYTWSRGRIVPVQSWVEHHTVTKDRILVAILPMVVVADGRTEHMASAAGNTHEATLRPMAQVEDLDDTLIDRTLSEAGWNDCCDTLQRGDSGMECVPDGNRELEADRQMAVGNP